MPAARTYEPIATYTASGSSTTFSFTSISSTYTDLRLVINGTLTSNQGIKMRFNSDSTTKYSYTRMYGNGTSAGTDTSANRDAIDVGYQISSSRQMTTIDIINANNSTTNKVCLYRLSAPANDGALAGVGLWYPTTKVAITTIDLVAGANYVSGTTATLYGITAA